RPFNSHPYFRGNNLKASGQPSSNQESLPSARPRGNGPSQGKRKNSPLEVDEIVSMGEPEKRRKTNNDQSLTDGQTHTQETTTTDTRNTDLAAIFACAKKCLVVKKIILLKSTRRSYVWSSTYYSY